MLSQRKFNIQKFKMSQEMRTFILDEVRKVIEANKTDVDSSETLKKTIEEKHGGKWQIVIGKDLAIYFDENIIKDYIILQTEIKTMIIFRKKKLEEVPTELVQTKSELELSIKHSTKKQQSQKQVSPIKQV